MVKAEKNEKSAEKYSSKLLYLNIFLLVGIGILMVYESSIVYAINNFGNKYHFLYLQSGWMTLGLVGLLIFANIKQEFLQKTSPLIWGISIFFLIIVLIPSPFTPEVYGARRWFILNPEGLLPKLPILGRVNFQPSEFSKLAGVIFFSSLISSDKIRMQNSQFRFFLVYFGLALLNIGLIALQPNFSTALILSVRIGNIRLYTLYDL